MWDQVHVSDAGRSQANQNIGFWNREMFIAESLKETGGSWPKYPQVIWKTETETEVAQSCPILCDPMDCSLPRSSTTNVRPRDFPGKSTGVGCHFLLQRIFQNPGSNLGLWRCRQTLYHLSRQGFGKAFLKVRYGRGRSQGRLCWSAHALFSNWLMGGSMVMSQRLTLSLLKLQETWGYVLIR